MACNVLRGTADLLTVFSSLFWVSLLHDSNYQHYIDGRNIIADYGWAWVQFCEASSKMGAVFIFGALVALFLGWVCRLPHYLHKCLVMKAVALSVSVISSNLFAAVYMSRIPVYKSSFPSSESPFGMICIGGWTAAVAGILTLADIKRNASILAGDSRRT